jgi:hypothetical protein
MSLGLGILVSTVLALVVWQIDKRQAWRKVRRALLWTLAAAILVTGVIYGILWWVDESDKRERAAKVAKVREPDGLVYWGISIGIGKPEVQYLKGGPTETEVPSPDGTPEKWVYRLGTSPNTYDYDIYWDKTGKHTVAIICQGAGASDCDRLAGLGPGSSESTVRETLGKPAEDNPPTDKGLKRLVYGTGKERLLFFLSRGQVDSIALSRKEDEGK